MALAEAGSISGTAPVETVRFVRRMLPAAEAELPLPMMYTWSTSVPATVGSQLSVLVMVWPPVNSPNEKNAEAFVVPS